MKDNQLTKEQIKAMSQIFSEVPEDAEIVAEFPTRGKFYNSSNPVVIRGMNFEDEKALASVKDKDLAIKMMITRCCSNLDYSSLISCDKDYLLLKIRTLTYGDDYKTIVTCPHCETKSEVPINIDKFVVRYAPDDFEDPREVYLPGIKKKATVRFIRESDSLATKDVQTVLDQLWRFVVSLDGIKDPQVIALAIKKFKSADAKRLISAIQGEFTEDEERFDIGIDPKFLFTCPSCKKESLMEAPIGSDFFTPS